MEVCPAWVKQRRVLVDAIGGDDLSRPALVIEAMVRGGAEVWEAVTSFCEEVMLAKEETEAERLRKHLAADLRLCRRPTTRRRPVRQTSHDDLQPP